MADDITIGREALDLEFPEDSVDRNHAELLYAMMWVDCIGLIEKLRGVGAGADKLETNADSLKTLTKAERLTIRQVEVKKDKILISITPHNARVGAWLSFVKSKGALAAAGVVSGRRVGQGTRGGDRGAQR